MGLLGFCSAVATACEGLACWRRWRGECRRRRLAWDEEGVAGDEEDVAGDEEGLAGDEEDVADGTSRVWIGEEWKELDGRDTHDRDDVDSEGDRDHTRKKGRESSKDERFAGIVGVSVVVETEKSTTDDDDDDDGEENHRAGHRRAALVPRRDPRFLGV